jgi:alpha-mannosidase
MDEFPALTFIRGEAAIYEHIEQFAPEIFARITAMIEAGRWDVVGGTYIQPDTNLTGEVTLRKHFERGLGYFQSHLGVRPTVAGLPTLSATALDYPTFWPMPACRVLPSRDLIAGTSNYPAAVLVGRR